MNTKQFSLCWNNFHDNLSLDFHTLLQNEDLVDVTLAAEGNYLKAHKAVLSICSPYFKELFLVNPCKHPIVILQDISYNALYNLLQFMYQGEVSVSQDEIQAFVRVAEILKIKGLTDIRESAGINELSTNESNYPHFDDEQSLERCAKNSSKLKESSPIEKSISQSPAKRLCKKGPFTCISDYLPEANANIKQEPADIADDLQDVSIQHLKLKESSAIEKSISQSPAKRLCKKDSFTCVSDYLPKTNANIKQEPTDLANNFQDDTSQNHTINTLSILDVKLGESTNSKTILTDIPSPEKKKKRGRCCYCGRKKNRATKYFCKKCGKYMCLQHCTYLCKECFYINNIE